MLYKRKTSNKWWVRFTAPDGSEVRQSTGTEDKRQAQEYEDKLRSSLWRQNRLGDKPERSWKEACVRWIEESAHKKKIDNDLFAIRQVDEWMQAAQLSSIGNEQIDAIIQGLRKRGIANASVNRITALVRAVLRKAEREWGWLDRAPSVRRLKEAPGRIRWITREEADRLIDELPEHLAAAARFSLATGLRAGNVSGLCWQQIDMERRVCYVAAENSKSGRAIGIPLNKDAVVVLREQIGKHDARVFTYNRQPIGGQLNTVAFRKALGRAGITDFRWHDLRHTWASWHVQSGTRLEVLKDLGGWNSYTMVLRYAHLAPEHLAEDAERIAAFRTVSATLDTQKRKSG
jgi:integrase